jgi:hypothetical protein
LCVITTHHYQQWATVELISIYDIASTTSTLRSSIMPVREEAQRSRRVVQLTSTQAYHSSFNDDTSVRQVGNMALLPINTKIRGPAPIAGMSVHLSRQAMTTTKD